MTHNAFRRLSMATLGLVAACSVFDTDISNPNAIEESALGDPASAPTLANGLNSAVTRTITTVYGPYHVASDELTWVGSREYWGKIDAGDVSDPRNEYNDAAYTSASGARWLAHYTVSRLEAFDQTTPTSSLANRLDLGRAYVYGAVAYITIADNFDDFIIGSDRTVPAAPLGETGMAAVYDSAIAYLDKAQVIATAVNNAELRNQVLTLRARAKYSKAVWAILRPGRTTPASPLVNDAGANADATAALAVIPSNYRYRVVPTSANTGTNNFASEMNSRQELRAGGDYINPDPAFSNLRPLPGNAGIKLVDPITNTFDPVIAAAINECCRSGITLVPITLSSWKEMQLILAEAALATGNNAEVQTRINAVRTVDALPAWDGSNPTALAMLQHERRVNLFLQSRRLHDLYRFGIKADRWINTNIAFTKSCFFPIGAVERQSNLLAPQPADARPAYCSM
jgi:starch-binding outer membrane protein, SusD/RagB family